MLGGSTHLTPYIVVSSPKWLMRVTYWRCVSVWSNQIINSDSDSRSWSLLQSNTICAAWSSIRSERTPYHLSFTLLSRSLQPIQRRIHWLRFKYSFSLSHSLTLWYIYIIVISNRYPSMGLFVRLLIDDRTVRDLHVTKTLLREFGTFPSPNSSY